MLSYHRATECALTLGIAARTRGTWGTGGLDVADTGADYNALVNRVGPELFYLGPLARLRRIYDFAYDTATPLKSRQGMG